MNSDTIHFEFDPKKSERNLRKHGISLQEAAKLWQGPSVQIDTKSEVETRWILIGEIDEKLYSCVFTVRGEKIRLISARRSRKKEQKHYEETRKNKKNHGARIRQEI